MNKKPILFSTPMVQAILDNRKTMTRRVIKPHVVDRFVLDTSGKLLGSYTEEAGDIYPTIDDCPYQPGDILWVRETFYHAYATTTVNGLEYVLENTYYYKADYPSDKLNPPWKPSIFMPREAARIFLRVTNVRVERLQEITEEDAMAEGVNGIPRSTVLYPNDDYIYPFKQLWNSLNQKRSYGWETNPWVWVISFEREG
jgi:hypothetical protein